jgi:hypothetical protein
MLMKKMRIWRGYGLRSVALACVVLSAASVEAGTVYWNADTISATSSTDVPGTITVGDISRGNNNGATTLIDSTSQSSGYTFSLNGVSTPASGSNNFGTAAYLNALNTATSTYFEFTITPASGTFPLQEIAFGSRSTNTGPQSWTLRSSADGYVADLISPGSFPNDSAWQYYTAPLTTVFTSSSATTFRIYGYNGTGTPSVNFANWRIDDVQAKFVPEPSTLMMLGLAAGLAGCGVCRRRRVQTGVAQSR